MDALQQYILKRQKDAARSNLFEDTDDLTDALLLESAKKFDPSGMLFTLLDQTFKDVNCFCMLIL